jgi:hypothetical protein
MGHLIEEREEGMNIVRARDRAQVDTMAIAAQRIDMGQRLTLSLREVSHPEVATQSLDERAVPRPDKSLPLLLNLSVSVCLLLSFFLSSLLLCFLINKRSLGV